MSTKSSNTIQPGFEALFSFSGKEDKLEHRAQMISYRILSEVEKICEEKGIRKKELAQMVNTSASYITQLFRGDKQVNTAIMAKFEEALEMMFEIMLCRESQGNYSITPADTLKQLNRKYPEGTFYYANRGDRANKTDYELLKKMEEENKSSGVHLKKQIV